MKLNNKHRSWVVIAVVVWLLVLAALIFLPLSKSATGTLAKGPTTLEQALVHSRPSDSEATAGELIDLSRIYDAEQYQGFITLCPDEPQDLSEIKIEQLGLDRDKLHLDDETGYMVLLSQTETESGLDKVNLNSVNICNQLMEQPLLLQGPLPFYFDGTTWQLGAKPNENALMGASFQ
ncbi:hypothetical protein [Corynebacterium mayonis]|uniref:hypothetical protein n=1 Tax=Corynebacterium mayonis TaxID=3062461 RepID=UPI003140205A